jgi:dihydrofolate synthase/folylpolyglutamate synthase
VEVAVVEAGLGGRWDATNVIDAEVVVLTNVGLEHTRWLGPTIRDIATEKLAVVGDRATLILGPDLHPDARALAERPPTGAIGPTQGRSRVVTAPATVEGVELGALGAFQRGNFALAKAAVEALVGELPEVRVREAARSVRVPGRFEVISERPLTILDGAHNPSGMQALAASFAPARKEAPLIAVVSVLDDKDATEMLRALLPHCTQIVCTSNTNPRALSPATLKSLTEQLGGPEALTERDPHNALTRAQELAGPDGTVLATGSIYLVADLLSEPGTQERRSRL